MAMAMTLHSQLLPAKSCSPFYRLGMEYPLMETRADMERNDKKQSQDGIPEPNTCISHTPIGRELRQVLPHCNDDAIRTNVSERISMTIHPKKSQQELQSRSICQPAKICPRDFNLPNLFHWSYLPTPSPHRQ
jgi:hypothetical protein